MSPNKGPLQNNCETPGNSTGVLDMQIGPPKARPCACFTSLKLESILIWAIIPTIKMAIARLPRFFLELTRILMSQYESGEPKTPLMRNGLSSDPRRAIQVVHFSWVKNSEPQPLPPTPNTHFFQGIFWETWLFMVNTSFFSRGST